MVTSVDWLGGAVARRKHSGIKGISRLPWPACLALGVAAYVGVRYLLGWLLSMLGGPLGPAAGRQLDDAASAPIAWLLLGACWLVALVSYLDSRRRKRLLDNQTGLGSLRAIDWREFEMLVGEAFRHQGYVVHETGLGSADGGVDLILRKDGATTLVQCRQWRMTLVDVKVVREMYGLMIHHRADAVKIVAIGHYTDDAQRFVEGKPIELIHGDVLLAMVKECQADAPPHDAPKPLESTAHAAGEPRCPACGGRMVRRTHRQTLVCFWGCTNYPECRGIRAA